MWWDRVSLAEDSSLESQSLNWFEYQTLQIFKLYFETHLSSTSTRSLSIKHNFLTMLKQQHSSINYDLNNRRPSLSLTYVGVFLTSISSDRNAMYLSFGWLWFPTYRHRIVRGACRLFVLRKSPWFLLRWSNRHAKGPKFLYQISIKRYACSSR